MDFSQVKYVVNELDGRSTILVFPDMELHSQHSGRNTVSAGFLCLRSGRFLCYGGSHSLGLKSRIKDSELANRQLGALLP